MKKPLLSWCENTYLIQLEKTLRFKPYLSLVKFEVMVFGYGWPFLYQEGCGLRTLKDLGRAAAPRSSKNSNLKTKYSIGYLNSNNN